MGKPTIFTGAGVALVTPFNPDGSVNFDTLAKLVEFQVQNGTDAIIACGTTGEASTLTDAEQIAVIRCVVDTVNKRIPVIAGAGSNDTAHGIELCRMAQTAGADALLLVTPYYNKTSQKGLIEHYTAMANAVDIPVILYNVPSRTGLNITAKTTYELSKVPNIVATKEASGNFSQIAEIAHLCDDDFSIYSGNDEQILPILALGGKGVISVLSNVAPRNTHDMVMKFFSGDIKAATKLQLDAIPLINALFSDVNPIPVKAAMNMMGLNAGGYRRPLTAMSDEGLVALATAVKDYKLI